MKNFLIVINTLGRAGAERALISLLKTIPPERYTVYLYSMVNRGEFAADIPPYVHVLNDKLIPLSVMDASGKKYLVRYIIKNLLRKGLFIRYIPYFIRNLFTQLKRRQFMMDKLFWKLIALGAPRFDIEFDLAIGYTEGAATYYVADYVKAKKHVAFVHVDYTKAGYMKNLDYKYYEKMDGIYCVSEFVRDGFCNVYPEFRDKSHVFLNILIPQEIYEKSEQGPGFTDDFDGLRLLTVARLHPQKALDMAISAFSRLVSEGCDNVRWYVLGEGPERPHLESLIAQHNLKDKFILCGAVSNPYPYFKNCDIYVQTSIFEGRGISISEALLLKRPVLTTRVSGTEEQINNGVNGLIVEPTEDDLLNGLKTIIGSSEMREQFSRNLGSDDTDHRRDVKLLYELLNERRRPRTSNDANPQ